MIYCRGIRAVGNIFGGIPALKGYPPGGVLEKEVQARPTNPLGTMDDPAISLDGGIAELDLSCHPIERGAVY